MDDLTLSTKEICPIMVDVVNAMLEAGIDVTETKNAFALFSVGHAMLLEAGVTPFDDDVQQGTEMLSDAFTDALVKKYG